MSTKHYAYIDALRGYAILLVIATHTSQMAPEWQGIGRKLVDQGARGVQLFFLVSALTLMISWYSRGEGALFFYIRRFFRIAPMFWLGIIVYTSLDGFSPRYWAPNGIDVGAVIATAFFVHGWYPPYFNSVVPGGWSIAVEMSFYLVFPLLAYCLRDYRKAIGGLIISLIVAYLSFKYAFEYRQFLWPTITHDYLTWTLVNLWVPSELPIFISGITLFFALHKFPDFSRKKANWLLLFSFIMTVLLATKNDPYYLIRGYLSLYAAYGLVFGLFAFALAKGAGAILINPASTFLGKISYSAYIWHFAILATLGGPISQFILNAFELRDRGGLFFTLCFPLIVIITSLISFTSYSFIEKPMISLGNRLVTVLKRNRRTQSN